VARLNEIFGRRRWVGHHANGFRAIGGADARRNVFRRIDGGLEIRFEGLAIVRNHPLNSKLLQPFRSGRHANQPAPELRHEVHRLRCDVFSGHDQIAFVFAIGIVDQDDHFAALDVGDYTLNGVKLALFSRTPQSHRFLDVSYW
jgi:hypothetical protein